ncbi:MAG: LytTR family DNA-binding domain-containing protein [Oscillospiraceae bacterium]|nr:LytTR family DNA-binding domain-containing protein [Oscillospiraceae bacterium]
MGITEEGIALVCETEIRDAMVALLSANNIRVDPDSPYAAVERGRSIPDDKIVILFEWRRVDRFFELIAPKDRKVNPLDPSPKTFIGKAPNDTMEIIAHGRICFFEARGNIVHCVTSDGEYRIKEKLYELEGTLPTDRFIRVSRSYIVNIENVAQIIPWFGRRLVLRFNNTRKEVEVSKSYAPAFKDFLGL